jgi:hypothetical protein
LSREVEGTTSVTAPSPSPLAARLRSAYNAAAMGASKA